MAPGGCFRGWPSVLVLCRRALSGSCLVRGLGCGQAQLVSVMSACFLRSSWDSSMLGAMSILANVWVGFACLTLGRLVLWPRDLPVTLGAVLGSLFLGIQPYPPPPYPFGSPPSSAAPSPVALGPISTFSASSARASLTLPPPSPSTAASSALDAQAEGYRGGAVVQRSSSSRD